MACGPVSHHLMKKPLPLVYPARINKYLAYKGYSTRRAADELIEKKKVLINGKTAVLGDKVNEGDEVQVLENTHTAVSYSYFIFNKPAGIASEEIDLESATRAGAKGLFPVGRLDKATRGLLLFTNDGRVTNRVLNPEYAHEREYEVTVTPHFSPSLIKILTLELKPKSIEPLSDTQFDIVLTEGGSDLRTVCNKLNFQVTDIIRTRVASLSLADLKEEKYRELNTGEREAFLSELGLA